MRQELALIDFFSIEGFILAMIIYFGGYALAPWVCHKKIAFLTGYPIWLQSRLEHFVQIKSLANWKIVLILALTNIVSLLLLVFSSHIPGMPFMLAAWLGLKLGIIAFTTLKGEMYFSSLLNPVALFELPAIFVSIALAFNFNLQGIPWASRFIMQPLSFGQHLQAFLLFVVPLLLVAAFFELILVRLAEKAGGD